METKIICVFMMLLILMVGFAPMVAKECSDTFGYTSRHDCLFNANWDTAECKCNDGYYIKGPKDVRCAAGGRWVTKLPNGTYRDGWPECIKDCPDHVSRPPLSCNFTGNKPGDTAICQCVDPKKYYMVGSHLSEDGLTQINKCGTDGNWGSFPGCIEYCPELVVSLPLKCEVSEYRIDGKANCKCDGENYHLKGSDELWCKPILDAYDETHGRWSSELPKCIKGAKTTTTTSTTTIPTTTSVPTTFIVATTSDSTQDAVDDKTIVDQQQTSGVDARRNIMMIIVAMVWMVMVICGRMDGGVEAMMMLIKQFE